MKLNIKKLIILGSIPVLQRLLYIVLDGIVFHPNSALGLGVSGFMMSTTVIGEFICVQMLVENINKFIFEIRENKFQNKNHNTISNLKIYTEEYYKKMNVYNKVENKDLRIESNSKIKDQETKTITREEMVQQLKELKNNIEICYKETKCCSDCDKVYSSKTKINRY